jgi:hypothetical protein
MKLGKPRRVALARCWVSAKAAIAASAMAHKSHNAAAHNFFGSVTTTKSYPGASMRSRASTIPTKPSRNVVASRTQRFSQRLATNEALKEPNQRNPN